MSEAQLLHPTMARPLGAGRWTQAARYACGVAALAFAYYAAAKLGQALRYTASVSAVWPPAGVGIAALYLYGLRWWPGVLAAEIVVNLQLLGPLPLASVLGQQAGNLAEVLVGALLLRRLIGGPRARADSAQRAGGVVGAVAAATALSASVGTLSMLATGVIGGDQAARFWRTWWLGDLAGGLIVVPAALAWTGRPRTAWRRIRTWDGAALALAVVAVSLAAVSSSAPVTYLVFPALLWAAFRFGPPGGTVAVAIAAAVVVGVTAHDTGVFSSQPIDHKTLNTQVYVVVMALTTLFLAAVVSERERTARALAAATRREGERALEERRRIGRELHDSVSQALFSAVLEARTAQKALADPSGPVARHLAAIAALARGAQRELRALISALDSDPVDGGLAAALARHAATLAPAVEVRVPDALPLGRRAEAELFGIAREALANVVRHAGATRVSVRAAVRGPSVVLEVRDDGRGFDPAATRPGHFGLDSMRARAAAAGGRLEILSGPGRGTLVRAEVPAGP